MATRRRGNGEGSIFRRADGRWAATITVGYAASGKRLRRTVYGRTKRAVQDKLTELQHRKATGTLADAGRMTVGEWLDHWVETIAKPQLRANTYVSYRGVIDKYLIPRLGTIRLTNLSPVNLQSLYTELETEGESGRQRLKVHAVLRRALNVAIRQRLVTHNVCTSVDPPKYVKPEMKTLTPEQVAAIISESEGDRFHALIVLAVTTGLRQGEMFGLRWGDIDLNAGVLSVRRMQIEVGGKLSCGPPKSKSGVRVVRLPAVAIEAMTAHRVLMMREGFAGASVVFCDTRGGTAAAIQLPSQLLQATAEPCGNP